MFMILFAVPSLRGCHMEGPVPYALHNLSGGILGYLFLKPVSERELQTARV